jgi:hypothetical protein
MNPGPNFLVEISGCLAFRSQMQQLIEPVRLNKSLVAGGTMVAMPRKGRRFVRSQRLL